MSSFDVWQSPLSTRYASQEMLQLFSSRTRASTWRQLWIWLAESQKELGLNVSDEAIAQMKAARTVTDEDFKIIAVEEAKRRHDVMAHVYAFGRRAPAAEPIIHLGATSCYVTDNADLIFLRDGLNLLLPKLAKVISNLGKFAMNNKDVACLGSTHGQTAQLITIGKRACQWLESFAMDVKNIKRARDDLLFRGAKGTTGTQASYLHLFGGNHEKVEQLDQMLAQKAGFPESTIVSAQTYNRKIDFDVANALASFGTSCEHMTTDIRHLAMWKEIEEPFEAHQTGSSAMAYKRNPMRSERICSLGRKLATMNVGFGQTYAHQWFERSLDDSAIRRIDIPEMFLIADALLLLLDNVTDGLVVNHTVVKTRIEEELPFMASENIIMRMVESGRSRQEAHEKIRVLSQEAHAVMKMEAKPNDLIERIKADPWFAPIVGELTAEKLLNPAAFIGRSPQQVERFVGEVVGRAIQGYESYINKGQTSEIRV